jgi:isocitrate lyase
VSVINAQLRAEPLLAFKNPSASYNWPTACNHMHVQITKVQKELDFLNLSGNFQTYPSFHTDN